MMDLDLIKRLQKKEGKRRLSNYQIINIIKNDILKEFKKDLEKYFPHYKIYKSKSNQSLSWYLEIDFNNDDYLNLNIRVSDHKRKHYYKDCDWHDANDDYDANIINFGVYDFLDLLINYNNPFDKLNFRNESDYNNIFEEIETVIKSEKEKT